MRTRQLATVKYQVATYRGEVKVNCFADEENEWILARAKAKVRKLSGGSLPFGYQSFKVISRECIC